MGLAETVAITRRWMVAYTLADVFSDNLISCFFRFSLCRFESCYSKACFVGLCRPPVHIKEVLFYFLYTYLLFDHVAPRHMHYGEF